MTATATETDKMSIVKHPKFGNLGANEACSPWELALNSFIRPGVADLSGQWTQAAATGPPTQGACAANRVVTMARGNDPITISLVSRVGFGAFFKNSARRVKMAVNVLLTPAFGLTCKTPYGGATFDFPQSAVNSTVVTLPTRMLKRDKGFTLRFSGSGSRTEPWVSPGVQGAREHFSITWSGAFRFRPAGCQEYFFLTGRATRTCAPA